MSSSSSCLEEVCSIRGAIAPLTLHNSIPASLNPEEVPFWPWGLLFVALGLYVVAVAALIAAGRREDARALAGFIPDCAVLVSRLARDSRISRPRRAVLFLVLGYLSFPLDLVPDFLPVAGQLDDAVLLGLALRLLVHGGGAGLVREAWPGPQASLTIVLRAAGLETDGKRRTGRVAP
jgi:uncharacterized membrane protein YkvA (DUF1232 family)